MFLQLGLPAVKLTLSATATIYYVKAPKKDSSQHNRYHIDTGTISCYLHK